MVRFLSFPMLAAVLAVEQVEADWTHTSAEMVVNVEGAMDPVVAERNQNNGTTGWAPSRYTHSNFEVAGRNLAEFRLQQDYTVVDDQVEPFTLFEDFDISDQIRGDENWLDMLESLAHTACGCPSTNRSTRLPMP